MQRRSSGEGSIYRRQDGRWVAAYQEGGKRRVAYGRTRTEAAERLRAIQEQARQAGRLPDAGRLTVGEYLQQWLAQAE